jgi:chromosome condensin MukBEF ATPase and DNA-binding subunit MukB
MVDKKRIIGKMEGQGGGEAQGVADQKEKSTYLLQDEELEDARAATLKKVKALEQQLENEHEERLNFVREKHDLESKIFHLQELAARSADEEQVRKFNDYPTFFLCVKSTLLCMYLCISWQEF